MIFSSLFENVVKMFIVLLCVTVVANGLHLRQLHTQILDSSLIRAVIDGIETNSRILKSKAKENNELLATTSDIQAKIKAIQSYLLNQRSLLLTAYPSSNIDVSGLSYTCPSINSTDKALLTAFNANIRRISNEMTQNSSSSNVKEEILDLKTVSNECILPAQAKSNEVDDFQSQGRTDINKGNFLTNSPDDIIAKFENETRGTKYLVTCPLDKPFADINGLCIDCPLEKPFFEFFSFSCLPCQAYNQTSRQCLDGIKYFTNFTAGGDKILLTDSQNLADFTQNKNELPICPSQTPFSTNNGCKNCSNSLYFSLSSGSCETCPTGKFYSPTSHRCQTQLYYSNLNGLQWATSGEIDDVMEGIAIRLSDQEYTSCPLDRPYAASGGCISCSSSTHFSYDSLNCTSCPQGLALDLNMHRCLKPGNLNFQTNPASPNLIFNGRSLNEWMNAYYREQQGKSGIVDCPAQTSNFDGLSCISCPHSHPYFNLELKVCATCEGTLRYDAQLRQCVGNADGRAVQVPTWEKMAAVVFAK